MRRIGIGRDERERVVEDLLSYMTPAEKVGQLVLRQWGGGGATPSLSESADFHDRLRRGLIGSVSGVPTRREADALQRVAVEETRLGIPLLMAASAEQIGGGDVQPTAAARARCWDFAALEELARSRAAEAVILGYNWLNGADIAVPDAGPSSDPEIAGFAEPWLAARWAASEQAGAGILTTLRLGEMGSAGSEAALEIIAPAVRDRQVGAIALDPVRHPSHRDGLALLRTPGMFEGILLSEWTRLAVLAGEEPHRASATSLSPERLLAALGDGRIAASLLDDAVRRVLRAKFDLGLFRAQFERTSATPAHQPVADAARDVATKSTVLLRNDPPLLPLAQTREPVLLVGAADDAAAAIGERLTALGMPVRHVPGLALRRDGSAPSALIDADRLAIGMACEAAKRARAVVVVLDSLGPAQQQLLASLRSVTERLVLIGLGAQPLDPMVGGAPLACIVHAGGLGSATGPVLAAILAGEAEPEGRLALPTPRAEGGDWPVGHGLGFGHVKTGSFAVEMGADAVIATLELRNASELQTTAIVRLYVRSLGRGDAPQRLRGHRHVRLNPGERKSVAFTLGAAEFGHESADGHLVVEAGGYDIALGLDAVHGERAAIELPAAIAAAMRGVALGLVAYGRS